MKEEKTYIITGIFELTEQIVNDIPAMVCMNETKSIQSTSLLVG